MARAWPVLLVLAACGGPPAPQPVAVAPDAALARLTAGLGAGIAVTALPRPEHLVAVQSRAGAVIVAEGWRLPDLRLEPPVRQAVRAFVADGGRLLLLGYTAALARDLGLEERPPDVCEPFRWGLDARTALGRARLGFRLTSGRVPELVAGLRPLPTDEHGYAVTGVEGGSLQGCWWRGPSPVRGEVLGRLLVERDGGSAVEEAPVLLRWTLGKGAVLACGLVPDPAAQDAAAANNAGALLQNLGAWLAGPGRGAVVCWRLPEGGAAPAVTRMQPLAERELPAAPLVAHWGWRVSTSHLRGDSAPVPPSAVLAEVLLPSFRAGADLLDLHLPDAAQGYPLAWSKADPLRRPDAYCGDAFWPEWQPAAVGDLAREAHARGMLVQALLDPRPAAAGAMAEQLAALRFLGRELLDRRRLGDAALDGVGLRGERTDGRGLLLAMLQDFQPAAHAWLEGAAPLDAGGAVRCVDADAGRPAGLRVAGISARFRAGFPADLYPAAALDARVRRADPTRWGDAATAAGSYPDWLVSQCNDFVRARIGRGAAFWWRSHDAGALGAETAAVAMGVALDPVRAAVAGVHTSTGAGGYRDLQRGLLPEVQAGFGAEAPVPAAGPFLQNNWLKLCGSGGSLLHDPDGLARFREGEAVALAHTFLRTRMTGSRPSVDELAVARQDLLAPGGMAVQLGRGGSPRLPETTQIDLALPPGRYELTVSLRGVRDHGVVELAMDGAVQHLFAFAEGRPAVPQRVPLHLAQDGVRRLQWTVVDGGAAAIETARLERVGDGAAEVAVGAAAGHCASLRETVASTYHREEVELWTLADLPGFLWRADCRRAARGLRMERTLQLLHHRRLDQAADGDAAGSLRGPFVLRGEHGLPDLAVVPLRLGRYDRFELLPEGGLRLQALPEGMASIAVGFLLLHGPRPEPAELVRMFRALERPETVALGPGRDTALVGSDLPLHWTRLLAVQQPWRTPYLVRENGWWLLRGAQPGPDGADWLRVCHRPGDTVAIRTGPALLLGTRPGPGSARLLALRDPEPDSVTVRQLQESCLLPGASVVMGADFDAVAIDGRPWHAFVGRTVLLPDGPGERRVQTSRSGGPVPPRVVATGARLQRCEWDPQRRELRVLAAAGADRPPELPLVMVIAGGRVDGVDGGAVVPEAELRHRDAAQAAAAGAGGTVIRCRPGLVRIAITPEATR